MSKITELQRQLEDAAGTKRRGLVVAMPEPTPVKIVEPKPAPKQPSRAGKKHVGAHLNPAFTTNLLMAKAKTGKKMETLIAEALNDLFRSLDLPVVAEE
jgi:hypothetical protein